MVGIYFTHQIAVYALSYFLPSIIGTYGKLNPLQIGLLTAIPWIFSAAGALLVPRFATDGRRSRLLVTGTMIGIVAGFALGAVGGPVLGMIGFCLAAFNFFALQPILFTYPATRLTGAALAGGIAFVNTIGLCGGFLGPYVMGFMQDATGSKLSGLWFIVGMCIIGALLSLMLKRGTEKPAAPRPPTDPRPTARSGCAAPRTGRARNHHCKENSWISARKAVLVTAGANGIGLAIANKFQELGAAVFVTDIDPDAVEKARVNGLAAAVSDVSDEDQVRALMATVREELGGLDVLVNNAGIAGPTGPLESLDAAAWKATFDVNIHGQFFCIKHALPMLRQGSGRLDREPLLRRRAAGHGRAQRLFGVEVGRHRADQDPRDRTRTGPDPGQRHLPRRGQRPPDRRRHRAKAEMLGLPADEVSELYHNQSSLGRLIEAEDIANMAAFAASDLARNVNGQALAVDGNTEKLY